MPNRRSFKTDESFLEKISIGAVGTKRVFQHLKDAGHAPIELERGSMSFKIWKGIKIKRVRVPDILCVKCGTRVESRAKTVLAVTMSHSAAVPDRGWDFGLGDADYIALVKCDKSGEGPTDWQASDLVQYIQVSHLRAAAGAGKTITERPKGAQEGFEMRLTWPSAVSSVAGTIAAVNSDSIKLKRSVDNRLVSLRLQRRNITLQPIVKPNDPVKESQIIASVVPVVQRLDCSRAKGVKEYVQMLDSPSLSDRYTAAKAIPHADGVDGANVLKKRIEDEREHIYIRLECAAGILKLGMKDSLPFFESVLDDAYLANRLECVIVLGEIQSKESNRLLIETLGDREQDSEIRAGAAWSLGELQSKEALDALVAAFDETDMDIKAEAARAMLRMVHAYKNDVMKYFPRGTDDVRAGISWALSKSSRFSVKELMPLMVDDDAKRWMAWIIGTQKEKDFISQIEDLKKKDNEVYFAVTVLWKILSSWIAELEVY